MTDTTGPTGPGQTAPPESTPEPTPSQPAPPQAAPPQAAPSPADPWALPGAGPEVVAAPEAVLTPEEQAAARLRRKARLRLVLAAGILAVTAAATTTAVLLPDRTDLPGLGTPNDGRYRFAPLALPPLPPGKAGPGADASHQRHFADLRQLLLPAPKGVADPAPAWQECGAFAGLFQDGAKVTALLTENACRAAASRTWTGPDGTRTEIWLLRFGSHDEAKQFYSRAEEQIPKPIDDLRAAGGLTVEGVPESDSNLRASEHKAGPDGAPVGRTALVANGDTVFFALMSNQHSGVPEQAFRQVTMLQEELLN